MVGTGVPGEVMGRPEELRGVKGYAGLEESGEWTAVVEDAELGGIAVR